MSQSDPNVASEKLGEDDDGELVAFWPTDEKGDTIQVPGGIRAMEAAKQTPQTGDTRADSEVGVLQRHGAGRNIHTLSRLDPKTFTLSSAELATTIKKFREEMYRNQFPVLVPAFEWECQNCGATYDRDVDECEICGSDRLREPDQEQKRDAKRFFDRVNGDGQSLRALMEYEEDYQSYRGVSVVIARKAYQKARQGDRVGDRLFGETYVAEVDEERGFNGVLELVHADSRVVLPITDEHNHHGGAWICPFHRGTFWTDDDVDGDISDAECPQCGVQLEEAGYAEVGGVGSEDVETLYLKDEVVSWARHYPEYNGLDGRSPVLPLIKLQAIIQFSRSYELSVLNSENTDRLPNKIVAAYGPNVRQALSASLDEESDKSAWETGEIYFDGPADEVEVDIIDVTPGGILEGREQSIQRYQQQIRANFGVSDAFENELSDTGGLNAEGTQIEIMNRAVAAAHQDTQDKALSQIRDVLGLTDWRIKYVDPKREQHELTPLDKVQAINTAQQAGIAWEISDGQLLIPDQTDEDADDPAPEGEGGPGEAGQFAEEEEDADFFLSAGEWRSNPRLIARYKRRYSPADAETACECLERIARESLWEDYDDAELSDVDAKAGNLPYMSGDEDVPEFTEELIDDVIDAGAIAKPDALDNRQFLQMENVVRDSLKQRNGWSIDSITRRFAPFMPDISPDTRRTYAINAVQNVLSEARALGYAVTDPPLEERWFYFGGPKNANICEACALLLEETDPSEGGTPMRWNALIDRMDAVNDEYFSIDNNAAQIHPSCVHSIIEYREGRGESESALP